MPFSAKHLICRYVRTDGRTDGQTDELIRVGLGNQRFLQVKFLRRIVCVDESTYVFGRWWGGCAYVGYGRYVLTYYIPLTLLPKR